MRRNECKGVRALRFIYNNNVIKYMTRSHHYICIISQPCFFLRVYKMRTKRFPFILCVEICKINSFTSSVIIRNRYNMNTKLFVKIVSRERYVPTDHKRIWWLFKKKKKTMIEMYKSPKVYSSIFFFYKF